MVKPSGSATEDKDKLETNCYKPERREDENREDENEPETNGGDPELRHKDEKEPETNGNELELIEDETVKEEITNNEDDASGNAFGHVLRENDENEVRDTSENGEKAKVAGVEEEQSNGDEASRDKDELEETKNVDEASRDKDETVKLEETQNVDDDSLYLSVYGESHFEGSFRSCGRDSSSSDLGFSANKVADVKEEEITNNEDVLGNALGKAHDKGPFGDETDENEVRDTSENNDRDIFLSDLTFSKWKTSKDDKPDTAENGDANDEANDENGDANDEANPENADANDEANAENVEPNAETAEIESGSETSKDDERDTAENFDANDEANAENSNANDENGEPIAEDVEPIAEDVETNNENGEAKAEEKEEEEKAAENKVSPKIFC